MSYIPGPAQPRNLEELWRYLQAEQDTALLYRPGGAGTALSRAAATPAAGPAGDCRRHGLGPWTGEGFVYLDIWEGTSWVQVQAL
ncbi:hypothetical protein MJO52_12735 [Microbulbifer variabilis]|uniref:Uncharacterized protein n=1 Tax=Microbulbifer variabilis TaxID=266805 RepID=A0ABY4VD98_9GAMM|nr:hypothetical protein [Microbulbifer variabilis]USD19944.1 hypothetical protein MJO52_12735 [Microbulbifer variabilis]